MDCRECFHAKKAAKKKEDIHPSGEYKFWGPVRCAMGQWETTAGTEKTYRRLILFNKIKQKNMDKLNNDGRCEHFQSMVG